MTLSPELPQVTGSEIAAGLRALGLAAGNGVVVHSSLKSFGQVIGGPRAVIEALMEVITPEGVILMPSFNHGAAFEEGGAGYYHPGETATTNGAIPDYFWRMPGVWRSLDPTHAVAAWGKHSRRYVEYHHRTLTMGLESPLGRLHAEDGFALLLGVGYGPNTFHHVVEMALEVPCLGQRTEAYPVVLPDGRRVMGRTWGWRERACPITDQVLYSAEMEARAMYITTQIGNCQAILFRLRDCFEVVAGCLRDGMQGFPPCSACPIRPRRTPETIESDWNSQTGKLRPDSTAWEY